MFPAGNGGTIELLYTQTYAPTTLAPARDFWTLRYTTSLDNSSLVVDMRGDLGMLSAHPLSSILSLHHFDVVEPIFPGMSRTQALEHLFKAVNVDPARILQQTVCYDHSNSFTVSFRQCLICICKLSAMFCLEQ